MINDEHTPDLEQEENENQEGQEQEETQGKDQNQNDSNPNGDEKDWKAEALKYKAILDRNKNKPEKKSEGKKSNDLDYGLKAFLVANGLKGGEEFKLAQDFAQNTGKSLDEVVENKYFLQELSDFREIKKTGEATPKSKSKSSNMSSDQVEYWLAKPFGELPDDFELRKKVVKARRDKAKNKGMFTPE